MWWNLFLKWLQHQKHEEVVQTKFELLLSFKILDNRKSLFNHLFESKIQHYYFLTCSDLFANLLSSACLVLNNN